MKIATRKQKQHRAAATDGNTRPKPDQLYERDKSGGKVETLAPEQ
jgi:hypothetical protein